MTLLEYVSPVAFVKAVMTLRFICAIAIRREQYSSTRRSVERGIKTKATRPSVAFTLFAILAGMAFTPSVHADTKVRPPIQGYQYSIYLILDTNVLGSMLCNAGPDGDPFGGDGWPVSRVVPRASPPDHPVMDVYCISTYPPTAGTELGPWASNWARFCQPGEAYIISDQTCLVSTNTPIAEKQPRRTCDKEGNPINPANSNKYLDEMDYVGSGAFPLTIKRSYNSKYDFNTGTRAFGFNWTSRYFTRMTIGVTPPTPYPIPYYTQGPDGVWYPPIPYETLGPLAWAYVSRADGSRDYFVSQSNGPYIPDSDVTAKFVKLASTWQYTTADDEVEIYDAGSKLLSITNRNGLMQSLSYDASGKLASVSDPLGRELSFTYDASNRVSSTSDPAGSVYLYSYDSTGNLSSVTYPDNTPGNSADNPKRIYLYNEAAYTTGTSLPNAMTGLADENGVRFATWTYDHLGRAISSEHAGGAEKVTLAYN
ncbi:MAG: DUF6531 domain-containing protein, partial [Burkholderiales bacterium]